jgi:hypothetical protein
VEIAEQIQYSFYVGREIEKILILLHREWRRQTINEEMIDGFRPDQLRYIRPLMPQPPP